MFSQEPQKPSIERQKKTTYHKILLSVIQSSKINDTQTKASQVHNVFLVLVCWLNYTEISISSKQISSYLMIVYHQCVVSLKYICI